MERVVHTVLVQVPRDGWIMAQAKDPGAGRLRYHHLYDIRFERVSPLEHPPVVLEERGVLGLGMLCLNRLAEVVHALLFSILL